MSTITKEWLQQKIAEPVAFINGAWTLVYYRPPKELGLKIGDKLFTAPPAPVSVPDERPSLNNGIVGFDEGWNACRDAMLQGADGNSPVIPDGWVLVPIEPTEDMIVNGFESEPDESFSDDKEWEAYEAMSGCQQAAHRAKLCWAAMIAAAPKLKHDLT